ncbi:hypothetical protein D3C72_1297830 [compost metagenome]
MAPTIIGRDSIWPEVIGTPSHTTSQSGVRKYSVKKRAQPYSRVNMAPTAMRGRCLRANSHRMMKTRMPSTSIW